MIANPIRRFRNGIILNKILRTGGLSRQLRKEIIRSYKEFTKILSFSSILKQTKITKGKGFVDVRK